MVAIKHHMTDDRRLFHLAFAEENVTCDWKKVKFSDEVTCSSDNDSWQIIYCSKAS